MEAAAQTTDGTQTGWGDVAAASAQVDPPPRVYTAPVMIKLTDTELRGLATTLGTERDRLAAFEAKKKAAATMHKDQAAVVERIAAAIAAQQEERVLEVEEATEFSTGRVVVRRKDTGEQISERPLTAEERQPSLFAKEATQKNEVTGDLFDGNWQYVGPAADVAEEDDALDDDADQDDEDADEEV